MLVYGTYRYFHLEMNEVERDVYVGATVSECRDFDAQYEEQTHKKLIEASNATDKAGMNNVTIGQSAEQFINTARTVSLESKGNLDEIFELYTQAGNYATRLNYGKYCHELANIFYDHQHFDVAISYYREACEYEPWNDQLYFNWGIALWRLNKVGMAIAQFKLAERVTRVCGYDEDFRIKNQIHVATADETSQAIKDGQAALVAAQKQFNETGFKDEKIHLLKFGIYFGNIDVVCQSFNGDLFDIDTLLNGFCDQDCSFVCKNVFPDNAALMTDFKHVKMECYLTAKEYSMALDMIEYLIIIIQNDKSKDESKIQRKQISKLYYYKARILTTVYHETVNVNVQNSIETMFRYALMNDYDSNPSIYHYYALFLIKFKKDFQHSMKYHSLAVDMHAKMVDCDELHFRHTNFLLKYSYSLWRYLNSSLNTKATKKQIKNQIIDAIRSNLLQMCKFDGNNSMNFEECGLFLSQYHRNRYELEQAYAAYAYAMANSGASTYYSFYFRDIDQTYLYHDWLSNTYSNATALRFNSIADVTDNDFELCQKYGFITFGQLFGVTVLFEFRFWHYLAILNNNSDIMPQFHCRNVIRIIRTSLLFFHKSVLSNVVSMIDSPYFANLSMISIGVLSIFMINANDYRNYDDQKLLKYLKVFIVDMIKPFVNKLRKIQGESMFLDTSCCTMSSMANRCLFISYWVFGNYSECKVCYDQIARDYCIDNIDETLFGITMENINWSQSIKCCVLLDYVEHIQCQACTIESDDDDDESIADLVDNLSNSNNQTCIVKFIKHVINPTTRNEQFYTKYKNTCQNRFVKKCSYCSNAWEVATLKKCKNCRKVMYCSRMCQKRDWVSNHRFDCMQLCD